MCLLPIHDLPRLIFLDTRDVTNLLILKWLEEPVPSAKCDTKVIISSAVPTHVDTDEIRSTGIFFHFGHGDVIFELAARPPGKRGARYASSSNVRSARNNHALRT